MIKTVETIFVAEDHRVGELIAATRTLPELIEILCVEDHLNDEYPEIRGLKRFYGEEWLDVLKTFSLEKIGVFFDWEISVRQVDLMEVI